MSLCHFFSSSDNHHLLLRRNDKDRPPFTQDAHQAAALRQHQKPSHASAARVSTGENRGKSNHVLFRQLGALRVHCASWNVLLTKE